jgi:hypothetical protein
LFFDAEYHDEPGAENANATQSEDKSSLENFLTTTDHQLLLQELQQSEPLVELSMDAIPIQPTAVAATTTTTTAATTATLTTDQKCIYKILFIILTSSKY